jgi:hypothetical protein
MSGAVAAAQQSGITLVPRSRGEVEAFFTGLDLVEPGVVPVLAWRPDEEPSADPQSAYYWAGLGRKTLTGLGLGPGPSKGPSKGGVTP